MTPQAYVDEIVARHQGPVEADGRRLRRLHPHHRRAPCEGGAEDLPASSTSRATSTRAAMRAGTAPPARASAPELQLKDGMLPGLRPAGGKDQRGEPISSGCPNMQDWLIEYIEEHPDFIQPASRTQRDAQQLPAGPAWRICASAAPPSSGAFRSTFDPKHVVYVWLDALTNYITALGYASPRTTACTESTGPPTCTWWARRSSASTPSSGPSCCMALGLPLPKQVFGHGWLVLDGRQDVQIQGQCGGPGGAVQPLRQRTPSAIS